MGPRQMGGFIAGAVSQSDDGPAEYLRGKVLLRGPTLPTMSMPSETSKETRGFVASHVSSSIRPRTWSVSSHPSGLSACETKNRLLRRSPDLSPPVIMRIHDHHTRSKAIPLMLQLSDRHNDAYATGYHCCLTSGTRT